MMDEEPTAMECSAAEEDEGLPPNSSTADNRTESTPALGAFSSHLPPHPHPEDAENLAGDSSSPRPPPFAVSDRVFCREAGSRLYPAVVRKIRYNNSSGSHGGWEFYVHYSGWNARWDRWRQLHELVRDAPVEREKYRLQQEQEQLQSQQQAPTTTTGTSASSLPSSSSSRKRKGRDSAAPSTLDQPASNVLMSSSTNRSVKQRTNRAAANAPQQSHSLPLEEYCELPLTLKTVLVEEWEKLSRKGWNSPHGFDPTPEAWDASMMGRRPPGHPARAVHHLPAKITVKQVLQHFAKSRAQPKPSTSSQSPTKAGTAGCGASAAAAPLPPPLAATPAQVQDFCRGLLELFEAALPACLLYPQERPQYRVIRSECPSKSASELYGCEYLLRLLVRLPALLQAEHRQQGAYVGPLLADLVALLQKNRQALFQPHKSRYRHPQPSEYLEWERAAYSSSDGGAGGSSGDVS